MEVISSVDARPSAVRSIAWLDDTRENKFGIEKDSDRACETSSKQLRRTYRPTPKSHEQQHDCTATDEAGKKCGKSRKMPLVASQPENAGYNKKNKSCRDNRSSIKQDNRELCEASEGGWAKNREVALQQE